MPKVTVAGIGPGPTKYVTKEVESSVSVPFSFSQRASQSRNFLLTFGRIMVLLLLGNFLLFRFSSFLFFLGVLSLPISLRFSAANQSRQASQLH